LREHRSFGGTQQLLAARQPRDRHLDALRALPAARAAKALLVYLAGLTCTEETFPIKAGAQRVASELGLALLSPDTSPRGTDLPARPTPGTSASAAGFYLDATQAPWTTNWRMESYLLKELLPAVQAQTGLQRFGLMGHSMGGHGALTLALRHPGRFASVSAIAPICAPTQCPWGRKAFSGYLGPDEVTWAAHDASRLMSAQTSAPLPRRHPASTRAWPTNSSPSS
jgi:S-formylglutathione hydrolase